MFSFLFIRHVGNTFVSVRQNLQKLHILNTYLSKMNLYRNILHTRKFCCNKSLTYSSFIYIFHPCTLIHLEHSNSTDSRHSNKKFHREASRPFITVSVFCYFAEKFKKILVTTTIRRFLNN